MVPLLALSAGNGLSFRRPLWACFGQSRFLPSTSFHARLRPQVPFMCWAANQLYPRCTLADDPVQALAIHLPFGLVVQLAVQPSKATTPDAQEVILVKSNRRTPRRVPKDRGTELAEAHADMFHIPVDGSAIRIRGVSQGGVYPPGNPQAHEQVRALAKSPWPDLDGRAVQRNAEPSHRIVHVHVARSPALEPKRGT